MNPIYVALVAPVVGFFRRVLRWDEPKVPDLRELRLQDALREVKIETANQEALRIKTETAKMEAERTIK